MNKMKTMLCALLLCALLPLAAAQAMPVLLVELPEDAQMVENVQFEDGDFIQSYQLEGGVTVQLLRISSYSVTIEELISSDWPVNCRVQMEEMTEISGYPAQHAHIWQVVDKGGYPVKNESGTPEDDQRMMEVDLVVVYADGAALIYQDTYIAGQAGDRTAPIIDSLKVQSGQDEAEVG